jgi:uncharacterized protein (DUF433 family)
MELESYFSFLSDDDMRLKGTRIGIETILEDFFNGFSPEEIAIRYASLTLGQVYATITYYLHNREKVDAYMKAWRQHTYQESKKADENPPEVVTRLRRLKAAHAQSSIKSHWAN